MKLGESGKAFSLIETMLAISIVALLATIAIPRITNLHSNLIISELRTIEMVIRFLQQKALASNHEQELIIDTQHNTYTYKTSFPPKEMTIPLNRQLMFGVMPNIKGPPAKPEGVLTSPCTFEQIRTKPGCYKIIIFSNGKVSSGTIYMTDYDKQYLGALTCPISQVSWMRVYSYENGRWINK